MSALQVTTFQGYPLTAHTLTDVSGRHAVLEFISGSFDSIRIKRWCWYMIIHDAFETCFQGQEQNTAIPGIIDR